MPRESVRRRCLFPPALPFNRLTVERHVGPWAGIYVLGYHCQGQLYPLYVGRSDSEGAGRRGSYGMRGRLYSHLKKEEWRPYLTHFTFQRIEDPLANFEAESWHYHHYKTRLNGAHPHHLGRTLDVCPEPGCYHHHTEAAAKMRALWLHDNGMQQGFFGQDWRTIRRDVAAAQWGYSGSPEQVFAGVLMPPLKAPSARENALRRILRPALPNLPPDLERPPPQQPTGRFPPPPLR